MKRVQKRKEVTGPRELWQSYSDMMAALLLMFVMMLLGITLLFRHSTKELEEKNEAYEAMSEDLNERMSEYDVMEDELSQRETELAQKEAELAQKESEYDVLEKELEQKTLDYIAQSSELKKKTEAYDAQSAELEEKKTLLEQAQAAFDAQSAELTEKTTALDSILGVRRSLVETLRKEFYDTNLMVDPLTGAISFDSNLLFGYNSSVLTDEGKAFLEGFFPRYVEVLLGESFRDYVAEIIIEGHTDTAGSYMYNLQLSQSRALAVASYFLSDSETIFTEEQRTQLRQIVTANGRSWSSPVLKPDGSVDMDGSRRVEILFRLKDQEMIEQMVEALSGEE